MTPARHTRTKVPAEVTPVGDWFGGLQTRRKGEFCDLSGRLSRHCFCHACGDFHANSMHLYRSGKQILAKISRSFLQIQAHGSWHQQAQRLFRGILVDVRDVEANGSRFNTRFMQGGANSVAKVPDHLLEMLWVKRSSLNCRFARNRAPLCCQQFVGKIAASCRVPDSLTEPFSKPGHQRRPRHATQRRDGLDAAGCKQGRILGSKSGQSLDWEWSNEFCFGDGRNDSEPARTIDLRRNFSHDSRARRSEGDTQSGLLEYVPLQPHQRPAKIPVDQVGLAKVQVKIVARTGLHGWSVRLENLPHFLRILCVLAVAAREHNGVWAELNGFGGRHCRPHAHHPGFCAKGCERLAPDQYRPALQLGIE